jgi:hypothetical protein
MSHGVFFQLARLGFVHYSGRSGSGARPCGPPTVGRSYTSCIAVIPTHVILCLSVGDGPSVLRRSKKSRKHGLNWFKTRFSVRCSHLTSLMRFSLSLTLAFLATPSYSRYTRATDSGISAQNATVQSLLVSLLSVAITLS